MDRDLVRRRSTVTGRHSPSLARTHSDRLYAIAQRILRDTGLAEDAVQQTLISASAGAPEPA